MKIKIDDIIGRTVLDSNGRAALEVEVRLSNGIITRSIAPRGSTTGSFEAHFVETPSIEHPLSGANEAVEIVKNKLRPILRYKEFSDQKSLDALICDIDPTSQKEILGGNVTIATSMSLAKAGSLIESKPLYEYLSGSNKVKLPSPIFNIIDGATTSNSGIGGIEFLLIPNLNLKVYSALEMGIKIRTAAQKLLSDQGLTIGDSTQGALLLEAIDCELALHIITESAVSFGLEPYKDFSIGLDLASSDYYDGSMYTYTWPSLNGIDPKVPNQSTSEQLASEYYRLMKEHPITFLEDGFSEKDTGGWINFSTQVDKNTLVVGDDLFASSATRILEGFNKGLANGVLIKPNQIGTITETLEAMSTANKLGMTTIVSQRSGENDDDFIVHLAIAGHAKYLKAGGTSRMDRLIKFNTLLRLNDGL